MLDLATKDEYIEKYKNIDPITDALYDACDLSQHIFDAANAVNDLINYPVEARERVVKADIERSLLIRGVICPLRWGCGSGYRRNQGGLNHEQTQARTPATGA